MASTALTLRDRLALVRRAISGRMPENVSTVGGQLVAGVVQPGGHPPKRGVKETLAAYSTMPWLRAVVSRISFDVASVEWRLYVKRAQGKPVRDATIQRAVGPRRHEAIRKGILEGDLTPVENHPVMDLVDNFNTFHTGLSGRRVTQQHLDLVGEAFWLLERDGLGMPIAIWPVPPSWILSTPTMARPFYRVSFRGWQGLIPATEFVWFSELDPLNPYGRGSGTTQSLADELETDEYTVKHLKSFYYNSARPDLIVSPKSDEATLQQHEVDRLEQHWISKVGGFWKSFKPFFLRRAVDIQELQQNFRSQQMIQIREFERNTILECFGVSPEILGIVAGGANRATITMADLIYGKRVQVPRLELLRTVMQERLIPEFDPALILDYVSPVSQDKEMELDAIKIAPWALTVDELRERQGVGPLPDDAGDVHMVPPVLQPTHFDALAEETEEDPEAEPAVPVLPAGDEAEAAGWAGVEVVR